VTAPQKQADGEHNRQKQKNPENLDDCRGSGSRFRHRQARPDDLGDIIGRVTPDDVLGRIFATFCVGK
jgi:tRNA U34 5-carboxymethylaminomethyl modifying GTPase MnmE/TrmE